MSHCKITLVIASVAAAVFGMPILSHPVQAGAISETEMIANACAICHGTDGKGSRKVPQLKGELEVEDFVLTMKGFQDGTEKATIMDRTAKGLSDEQIKKLAEYYANLK